MKSSVLEGEWPSRNVRRERAQSGGAGISGMWPQVVGAPTGRSTGRPRPALSAPPLREGGFALGAGMSLRVTGSGFFHRSRVVSHALFPTRPSGQHFHQPSTSSGSVGPERCRAQEIEGLDPPFFRGALETSRGEFRVRAWGPCFGGLRQICRWCVTDSAPSQTRCCREERQSPAPL